MGLSNGIVDTLMYDFLRKSGGVAVIDGGLATELERHGADLNDPLWSAKCLLTSGNLVRQVSKNLFVTLYIYRCCNRRFYNKNLPNDEDVESF